VATGLGCGDLDMTAAQCITQADCSITLSSVNPGGKTDLNGTTPIDASGAFTGAAIKMGSAQRSGCVGMWDAATSTLTVTCGGTDATSTQYCSVALKRTGTTCP
jgi:hypothetical protein